MVRNFLDRCHHKAGHSMDKLTTDESTRQAQPEIK